MTLAGELPRRGPEKFGAPSDAEERKHFYLDTKWHHNTNYIADIGAAMVCLAMDEPSDLELGRAVRSLCLRRNVLLARRILESRRRK